MSESVLNFIKKRLNAQTEVFSSQIYKIFKNTYFEKYLWTTASDHGVISDQGY